MQMQRQKKQNKPFQEAGCILILLEMPCHTTVLQCHPLQQPVVHIIANANGEEAELITDGILGVAEDFGWLCFPNSGPPVSEEDDQRDASGIDVVLSNVII